MLGFISGQFCSFLINHELVSDGDAGAGDRGELSEVRSIQRDFGLRVENRPALRTMGFSCISGNQCPLTGFPGSILSSYHPLDC